MILNSYQRKCPNCDKIIEYSSARTKRNADRNGSKCAACCNIKHVGYNCPKCGAPITFKLKSSMYRAISKKSLCRSCSNSERTSNAWQNDGYRQAITDASNNFSIHTIKKLSDSTISLWLDDEYKSSVSLSMSKKWKSKTFRDKMLAIYKTDEYKSASSVRAKSLWNNSGYRKLVTDKCRQAALTEEALDRSRNAAVKQWQDSGFRLKMQKVLANQPKVSSIQNVLYSLLDDLGLEYYREYNDREDDPQCVIGPYHFDCVIPCGETILIIECQGNYWHSLPNSRRNDKAKKSYIENNFPNYRIKYLWEHEFYNLDQVSELIKYWTGADFELIEFEFSDLEIRKCVAADYRDLLLKYHYLSNAGRGGTAVGCFLDDTIIAVVVFSPLPRQNIGLDAIELSRFCIHPLYQKRNLGSWFLSRAIKAYAKKDVMAYADTTFNHTGAVYKACGFEFWGNTNPDYWYVNNSGWVMHKKTLYNRARNLKLKESEFAESFGYVKVYGGEKLRFLKRIKG